MDLEFEANLVYRESSWTARLHKEVLSQKEKEKNNLRAGERGVCSIEQKLLL